MSVSPPLPDDLEQCQQLLRDLLCRNNALRQQVEDAQRQAEDAQRQAEDAQRQAEDAQRQAEDAQRQVTEFQRVLDTTAADYSLLQDQHAELAETLALFRRYVFGPRRERLHDDPGQGHLFALHDAPLEPETVAPAQPDATPPHEPTRQARPQKHTRLDHLPQNRIEHDLPEADKICPCCGGAKHRIGEDLSRELEFTPAKHEVKKQTWCLRCQMLLTLSRTAS